MDGNTRLCTATAAAALKATFGTDGQPGSYADVDHCDAIVLWGHNVAETQAVLWMHMLDRRRGPSRGRTPPRTRSPRSSSRTGSPAGSRPEVRLLVAAGAGCAPSSRVPFCVNARVRRPRSREGMTESDKPGSTELKELMGRVLESDASEAFGQFMLRQIALNDMAPNADEAVLEGIEESPDGGAAMAEAHLLGLSDQEREELLDRAGTEAGRRLHAAAVALLAAVGAARLPVDVSPEMVAVAAITELGDSTRPDSRPV